MTITVSTPDGGTAEFPDGTDTGVISSAMSAKFGGPSGGAAKSPDNDYSNSPWSAIGRTFESSADWGTGDLVRAVATGKKPSETAAQSSAAAESLPWYIRYPTEAAGYGLGLVNLLDPVTDAAEGGALALGAGAKLAKVAGTAAEGATVGGTHYVATTDDPTVGGALGSAAGGALINSAAAGVAPLANKVLTKTLGKNIDPDAAIAATKADTQQAFGTLKQTTVPHDDADKAISSVLGNLNGGEATGVKPIMGDIADIRSEIANRKAQQIPITADDLNSWAGQIKDAASPGVSSKIAGQIGAELKSVVGAQGGAGAWDAAQAAAKRQAAAESLKDYGQTLQEGGSLGQAPLNEAKRYYPNPADKAQYDTMAGLSGMSGGPGVATSLLGHLAATGLGFAGEHIAGIPGALAGEALAYLGAKPLIKRGMKGYNSRRGVSTLQSAYPTLTGQQPPPGPQISPKVGDAIKSAVMGSVY